MKPAAHISAAIDILDQINDGAAAEQSLTRWGRQNRYAGSKDRAAVRDLVFDALRRWRLAMHYGGGDSGRAVMIGLIRLNGDAPENFFTGEGYAPVPLNETERSFVPPEAPDAARWNLPDWLIPQFEQSLAGKAGQTVIALQERAPVSLRVNTAKGNREGAIKALKADGITASPISLCDTAIRIEEGARRIRQSGAFSSGIVELQDAGSQAIVNMLTPAIRPLDYCAGGGGKTLALAAHCRAPVFAHDADPGRMSDLPQRAARAGADVQYMTTESLPNQKPFDLVLCDVPCSGSGAWRRAPEGKWSLTPDRLLELNRVQDEILQNAKELVSPGGLLVYATCSILACENEERVAEFTTCTPGWRCVLQKRFNVSDENDGFFTAHLTME